MVKFLAVCLFWLMALLHGNASMAQDSLPGKKLIDSTLPVFSFGGFLKPRVPAAVFKKADTMVVSNDYVFVDAIVYFGGANFPRPTYKRVKAGSIDGLRKYLELCIPGTSVCFDEINVRNAAGEIKRLAVICYGLF